MGVKLKETYVKRALILLFVLVAGVSRIIPGRGFKGPYEQLGGRSDRLFREFA